ncbi:VOC family protein [candidate division GN15 bacterium]|nr:VOC family protein [candidate division GN15 bacterium]
MADDRMKAGHFSWNELMTTDTDKSGKFLTELLGWDTQEMPMPQGTYTVFKVGDAMVGGMMGITEDMGPMPPMWGSYVTVDDVDASAKKAEELGGKIIVPPTDIPNVGRFCCVADPAGAGLNLITYSQS